MNADDIRALSKVRQSIFVRVHADGVDLVALGFKHDPELRDEAAIAVGQDQVGVFENEHPREMFNDELD